MNCFDLLIIPFPLHFSTRVVNFWRYSFPLGVLWTSPVSSFPRTFATFFDVVFALHSDCFRKKTPTNIKIFRLLREPQLIAEGEEYYQSANLLYSQFSILWKTRSADNWLEECRQLKWRCVCDPSIRGKSTMDPGASLAWMELRQVRKFLNLKMPTKLRERTWFLKLHKNRSNAMSKYPRSVTKIGEVEKFKKLSKPRQNNSTKPPNKHIFAMQKTRRRQNYELIFDIRLFCWIYHRLRLSFFYAFTVWTCLAFARGRSLRSLTTLFIFHIDVLHQNNT